MCLEVPGQPVPAANTLMLGPLEESRLKDGLAVGSDRQHCLPHNQDGWIKLLSAVTGHWKNDGLSHKTRWKVSSKCSAAARINRSTIEMGLVAVFVCAASEPFPSASRLILKGQMAGNGEFDLRTRGGTRKDMEAGADSVGSFPHTGKPPMSIPAGL